MKIVIKLFCFDTDLVVGSHRCWRTERRVGGGGGGNAGGGGGGDPENLFFNKSVSRFRIA